MDDDAFTSKPILPESLEKQVSSPTNDSYVLRLYVAGLTPRSTLAVDRVRRICDRYLAGRFELTVIDLYLHPEAAKLAQIVVAPTLIKHVPSPVRMFIGDMSDEKKILRGLNINH